MTRKEEINQQVALANSAVARALMRLATPDLIVFDYIKDDLEEAHRFIIGALDQIDE